MATGCSSSLSGSSSGVDLIHREDSKEKLSVIDGADEQRAREANIEFCSRVRFLCTVPKVT